MNGGARRAPLPSLLPSLAERERERERERVWLLRDGASHLGLAPTAARPSPNPTASILRSHQSEKESRNPPTLGDSTTTTAVTAIITVRQLVRSEKVDEHGGGHNCSSKLQQRGHDLPTGSLSFSDVIYQHHPAQCITNAMVGPRSWLGGLFFRYGNRRNGDRTVDFTLTPLQEQRLQRLKERLNVPFDETRPDHQEALKALWNSSFPKINLTGLISEQWKDMGWQGPNPSTDFRGCGFVSLENLLFFARTYPASFQRILCKRDGVRAAWEYPFAVAGINVSFMLIQMLDLYSEKPKTLAGMNFVRVLSEDEEAFDVLYSVAFQMMDAQWLAMRASYLQFNEVLQATRIQLERELALEDVHRIQDLPAYNLLYK